MKAEVRDAEIQRRYYAQTAQHYDQAHAHGGGEHEFAYHLMLGMIDYYGIASVLEIGSGTGNTLLKLKAARLNLRVHGIEPSAELRAIAYQKGLNESELSDGDGMALAFSTGAYDLVCEFAVLHHVRQPNAVVEEMLRVAKRAILISDSNNFGQGRLPARLFKQFINAIGLWPLANWVKTGGKGFSISEGDGLAYSYSVFNNYRQIAAVCEAVRVINTNGNIGINPYRNSATAAILGVKRGAPQK